MAAVVGVEPLGMLAAMAEAIAEALLAAMGTSTLVETPQSLSCGKISRPHLIWPCSAMTVWLMAAVIWLHLLPRPLPGSSAIEPDLSRMISRSGGRPFCSMKSCSPQLGSGLELGSGPPVVPPLVPAVVPPLVPLLVPPLLPPLLPPLAVVRPGLAWLQPKM